GSVRSVSLGFWIGAGSRDEAASRAGVTHFIEHLLFKGTGSYSAQEIAEIFDGLGGELNAATSREHTVVYARVPDRHLETALDVMADMVFAPTFADVDAEREVVLEEIAMVEDTPQDLVRVGAPGISRSDRRRFAASLLDAILGGSASSRLFQEIREKRGMAYSVYSFASQYTDSGLVGIYVGTREENLAACLEICAEQIAEIAAGTFRTGELERAKE